MGPSVKRLSSGYWHVRWNNNQWLQWPYGCAATLDDGFGWVSDAHVAAANRLVDEYVTSEGGGA